MEMWKAPHWTAAIPSATSCGRHSIRRAFSAPYARAFLRDVVVVGLVGLAEIGRVGVGNRPLGAHPVQRRAGVESARERDAHFLAKR